MATANPYLKGLATGGPVGINQTTGLTQTAEARPVGRAGVAPLGAVSNRNNPQLSPYQNPYTSAVPMTSNLGMGGTAAPTMGPQPQTMQPMQSMQPQTSNLGMGGPTMGTPFNGSGAPSMGEGGMGVNPNLAGGSQPALVNTRVPATEQAWAQNSQNLGMGAPSAPSAAAQNPSLSQYYKDRLAYMQQTGKSNPSPNAIPGWSLDSVNAASKASTGQSQEADDAQTQAYRAMQSYKMGMGPNPNGGPNHQSQMGSMQGQPGNGQPLGMGGTGQNLGMGGAWNQYTPSPYLQQQLDGLQGQFNENLGNTLHGQNQQAVSTGNLGSSRSGLMAGQAIGDSQTGFANAATNMLGADYQAQMARNLQNKGLDQSLYLGNQANDTARFGITTGANTAKYSTDAQSATAAGQLGLGYANNALQGALGFAGLDQQKYNTDAQTGIAQGQLGLGYLNANNNFTLGSQSNANQATGLANSYQLGTVANQNAANQNANAYQLGTVANQNAANANANNFNLGQNANANQAMQIGNNFALGQGQLGLGQNQQAINFFSDQRSQDRQDLGLGASLYQSGINGQWSPIQNYNGLLTPYTGTGTVNQTTGGQPGNWQTVLAGLLAGGQFGSNLLK